MSYNRTAPSNRSSDDTAWKAAGFINVMLPAPGTKSGFRKLGDSGISLRDSVPSEKAMREWIEKDPEKALAILLANIKLEYRSATPQGNVFDFDAMSKAAEAKIPGTGTNG
jgi:hypothetical protein